MKFSEIIGHDFTKDQWTEIINRDRQPHALLMIGKEGSGMLNLALAYAQRIFCQNPDGIEVCGECSQCLKIQKLSHPDINFSYPYDDPKITAAEYGQEWRDAITKNPYINLRQWMTYQTQPNKRGNIPTKEIQRIIESLQMHSYEGGPKVHIIWIADMLGKEGNKLLKLIEEPPANTYIILIAMNEELILPTIISRCQTFYIKPYRNRDVEEILVERFHIGQELAHQLSRIVEGDVAQAISLAQEDQKSMAEVLIPWLRDCYLGHPDAVVSWAEKLSSFNKNEQAYFLKYTLHFLRQLPLFSLDLTDIIYLSSQELKSGEKLSNMVTARMLSQIQEVLDQAIYSLERNANSKLLFMTTTLRIHRLLRSE